MILSQYGIKELYLVQSAIMTCWKASLQKQFKRHHVTQNLGKIFAKFETNQKATYQIEKKSANILRIFLAFKITQ